MAETIQGHEAAAFARMLEKIVERKYVNGPDNWVVEETEIWVEPLLEKYKLTGIFEPLAECAQISIGSLAQDIVSYRAGPWDDDEAIFFRLVGATSDDEEDEEEDEEEDA
jgi:hypothetical protein